MNRIDPGTAQKGVCVSGAEMPVERWDGLRGRRRETFGIRVVPGSV